MLKTFSHGHIIVDYDHIQSTAVKIILIIQIVIWCYGHIRSAAVIIYFDIPSRYYIIWPDGYF